MDFHRGGDTSSIFEDLYSCMIIMTQFRPDFNVFVLFNENIVLNSSLYLQDEKRILLCIFTEGQIQQSP